MKKVLFGMLIFIAGCSLSKTIVDIAAENKWAVAIDKQKPKKANEYDTIVIGSGIGGLSCAALLAKNGYKVLVLEQQEHVGGFCSSFTREGFTFPAGAHDISGVERGAIRALINLLDLKKDDLFALHSRTYFVNGKKIELHGTKKDVIAKLSEHFPAEKKNIVAFFDEAEKAFEEQVASIKDPTKQTPTYNQWEKVTYQQKLDEYFNNTQLKKFLCSFLGYLGTPPEKTVATAALMAGLSYWIYGGHFPKRGGQAFADALKRVIESHKGTVLTKTKVDQILVKDNHVAGVRTGGNVFTSPVVVANVNAKTLFLKLIPQDALDPAFVTAIKNLKMSISVGAVHLGVNLDLSHLTSIIVDLDNKASFHINSNTDPTMAPSKQSSISMGLKARYADVPPTKTPEYQAYKEQLAQKAIAAIEKVIPGLKKHIVAKNVVTPRTFEQFTSMPEGAIYSFSKARGHKRPYFKTPITGLYLASASTGFGGGVEAVAHAGLRCAGDIRRSAHRK